MAAEDREAELDDEAHVPAAAVEHATGDAASRERGDGELAEMGGDRVIARVDRDVTGGNLAEHLQHLAQAGVVRGGSRPASPERCTPGPASFMPRSSGRIEGGSVSSGIRACGMYASAAV